MIRDEVLLRTACGCEKVISHFTHGFQSDRVQVSIPVDPPEMSGTFSRTNADYTIRRFHYHGRLDREGRRIYQEVVSRRDDTEDWKYLYQELYKDVYGVDKGL